MCRKDHIIICIICIVTIVCTIDHKYHKHHMHHKDLCIIRIIFLIDHKHHTHHTYHDLIPPGTICDISLQREREVIRRKLLAAEQKTKDRNLFMASVSHEMRTPMNAIIATSELLLESQELSDDLRSQVQLLFDASRLLLHLIDNLLDWCKIDAGKIVLVEKHIKLHLLVSKAIDILAVTAQSKNIVIRREIQEELLELLQDTRLLGDPNRFSQVLINLISNAVKFTSKGEVVVKMTLIEARADQLRLRFVVSDTGNKRLIHCGRWSS